MADMCLGMCGATEEMLSGTSGVFVSSPGNINKTEGNGVGCDAAHLAPRLLQIYRTGEAKVFNDLPRSSRKSVAE